MEPEKEIKDNSGNPEARIIFTDNLEQDKTSLKSDESLGAKSQESFLSNPGLITEQKDLKTFSQEESGTTLGSSVQTPEKLKFDLPPLAPPTPQTTLEPEEAQKLNPPSPPLQPISVPPLEVSIGMKYAGFWIRFAAALIDGIIIMIPSIILLIILAKLFGVAIIDPVTNKTGSDFRTLSNIAGLLVGWLYFIFMTSRYQATLGKMAVGIKVVSEDGESLGLGQVVLRETIGKFISQAILFVGYIMVAFTKKKQALHDKLAGTYVVFKNQEKR